MNWPPSAWPSAPAGPGLRAMTSTSGAGISLMSEYAGLAYYTEVPLVVWNVQRVGPSTGLPTRTSQGDLTQAYFLSQGDTRFIILIPGSVNECFEFGWKAFDIAERYQTPVIVLSDLDLGMNQWMTPEFVYPDKPFDRGKILWEEDLEKIKETWGRYKDLDGDLIPYRTVPGNKHPNAAYFARGTGHDDYANYSEDPEVWEAGLKRISDKVLSSRDALPTPVIDNMEGAKFGIILMGSAEPAVDEARAILAQEGLPTDCLRVRALPLASCGEGFHPGAPAQLRHRAQPGRAAVSADQTGTGLPRGADLRCPLRRHAAVGQMDLRAALCPGGEIT